jgi:hypothetical protein
VAHDVKILLIDDNTLEEELELTKKTLAKNGIRVHETVILIDNEDFRKQVTMGKEELEFLDEKKIKGHFNDNGILQTSYDIVACDFNFSDDNYNGYELLTWIINEARTKKLKIRNAKFIFYSGDIEALENVAGRHVKRILPLKIDRLVDREHLPENLIKMSANLGTEVNLTQEFLKLFDEHEHKFMKATYPHFNGLSLGQIRDEIESESVHSNRFLKALIEQTFAHMIDLDGG